MIYLLNVIGGSLKKSRHKTEDQKSLTYAERLAQDHRDGKHLMCPQGHTIRVANASALFESQTGCSLFGQCPTCNWASGF